MNKQEIARIIDEEAGGQGGNEISIANDICDWMMGEKSITMTEAHWAAVRQILGEDRLYLLDEPDNILSETDLRDLRIAASAVEEIGNLFPCADLGGVVDRLNRVNDVLRRHV